MPHYHAVRVVKELLAVAVILQLLLELFQRPATFGRVRLVHKQVPLALRQRRLNFTKAIARPKVCAHKGSNTSSGRIAQVWHPKIVVRIPVEIQPLER
eukprot:2241220-Prymnesium_polylepis.1